MLIFLLFLGRFGFVNEVIMDDKTVSYMLVCVETK